MDNGENVRMMFERRNATAEVKALLPFDNEYKRKVVIRRVEGKPDIARIYTKGAPENIIPLCTKTLNSSNEEIDFTSSD
jgi:magnesium-transporting ATPase (P-type)